MKLQIKIPLLILIISILFIGLTLAGAKFKSYDKTTEKIQVYDVDGSKAGDWKLLNNSCDAEKRFCHAIIEADLKKNIKLVDNFDFYKLVGDELIDGKVRWHREYIYTLGEKIDVQDYGWVCLDDKGKVFIIENLNEVKNGTNCSYGLTGSHKEDAPEWTPYNSEFFNGKKILKIEAEKRPSWTIDWVATVFDDVKLSEWAIWGNISEGDEAEVVLVSPANGSTSLTSSIIYNCSANITNGASINSMGFYSDRDGWGLKDFFPYIYDQLSDASVNTSLWTIETSNGGTVTETAGMIDVYSGIDGYLDNSLGAITTTSLWNNSNFTNVLISNESTIQGGDGGGDRWITVKYYIGSTEMLSLFSGNSPLSYVFHDDIKFQFRYFSNNDTIIWRKSYNYTYDSINTDSNGWSSWSSMAGTTDDQFKVWSQPSGNSNGAGSSHTYIKSIGYLEDPTINNLEIPETINGTRNWNCYACDTDGVCAFAPSNSTIYLDSLNFTIVSPSGTSSSPNITINYSIGSVGDVNYTYYNITKGASTEKENTPLNASDGFYNDTYTLTGEGTYIINLWANQSGGISNTTSIALTYTAGVVVVVSGGGGGGVSPDTEETIKTETCEIYVQPFASSIEKFKEETTFENFVALIKAFFDRSICDSAGSIVPII